MQFPSSLINLLVSLPARDLLPEINFMDFQASIKNDRISKLFHEIFYCMVQNGALIRARKFVNFVKNENFSNSFKLSVDFNCYSFRSNIHPGLQVNMLGKAAYEGNLSAVAFLISMNCRLNFQLYLPEKLKGSVLVISPLTACMLSMQDNPTLIPNLINIACLLIKYGAQSCSDLPQEFSDLLNKRTQKLTFSNSLDFMKEDTDSYEIIEKDDIYE